ncbi:hypothetical protein [Streptomyces sp. NBC_01408]|uniref:hypothetical protein n=1 Tax=Streptomyces sp. NBC_01408 TaxID=2903855 RepID=UPI00224CDEC2|nr:hypothetical protein [Streptomyces sp. NBC_01408]MCX4695664.1 hypothetical protein [Streptomyces sp. NBC_01408]
MPWTEHRTRLGPQHADAEVHTRRKTWPLLGWDSKWDGLVSIHQNGSVLATRVLP